MVANVEAATVHLARHERQVVGIARRTLHRFLDGVVGQRGGPIRRRRRIVQCAIDVGMYVTDARINVEPQIAGTIGLDRLALVAVEKELASLGVLHEDPGRHRLAGAPLDDGHRAAEHRGR